MVKELMRIFSIEEGLVEEISKEVGESWSVMVYISNRGEYGEGYSLTSNVLDYDAPYIGVQLPIAIPEDLFNYETESFPDEAIASVCVTEEYIVSVIFNKLIGLGLISYYGHLCCDLKNIPNYMQVEEQEPKNSYDSEFGDSTCNIISFKRSSDSLLKKLGGGELASF